MDFKPTNRFRNPFYTRRMKHFLFLWLFICGGLITMATSAWSQDTEKKAEGEATEEGEANEEGVIATRSLCSDRKRTW